MLGGLWVWCRRLPERLMVRFLPVPRLVMAAGLLALAVSACGRRGALEAPPDPSAPSQQSAEPAPGALPSPIGTPNQSASRRAPYVKPKKPFILDPLL
jgi:predicted small lipoprotein YifL